MYRWLTTPFEAVTLDVIAPYWFGATAVLVLIVLGVRRLGLTQQIGADTISLTDSPPHRLVVLVAIVGPVLEELTFRALPIWFGFETWVVVALTGLWVLFHGRRAPFIALYAPLYLKLALGGFLFEAVLIHIVHNTVLVAALLWSMDRS